MYAVDMNASNPTIRPICSGQVMQKLGLHNPNPRLLGSALANPGLIPWDIGILEACMLIFARRCSVLAP